MTEPIASDRLLSFVLRIERLMEERSDLNADIREVFAEAKVSGFDAKTIRKVVAERKKDPEERSEQLHLFELYWGAIQGSAEKDELFKGQSQTKTQDTEADAHARAN